MAKNGPTFDDDGRPRCRPSVERLRLALDLFEAGVDLERQRLRRAHPDLDDAAIEARLGAWLRREGEPGDAPGRPRPWPGQLEPSTARS
jgi:hypothetical protein